MLSPALLALRQNIQDHHETLRSRGREPSDLSLKLMEELILLDKHFDLDGFFRNLVRNSVISEMPPGPVVGSADRCAFCNCHPGSCP